jgi:PhnB protein
MNSSSTLDIYINYPGNCQEAFTFYEQRLGGIINMIAYHEQIPPNFPKEWPKPVLHAVMTLGGTNVRGADVPGA